MLFLARASELSRARSDGEAGPPPAAAAAAAAALRSVWKDAKVASEARSKDSNEERKVKIHSNKEKIKDKTNKKKEVKTQTDKERSM